MDDLPTKEIRIAAPPCELVACWDQVEVDLVPGITTTYDVTLVLDKYAWPAPPGRPLLTVDGISVWRAICDSFLMLRYRLRLHLILSSETAAADLPMNA